MRVFGTETFTIEPDVTMQAFKVCEEAHEVFQEAKHLNDADPIIPRSSRMRYLREEMADVMQAVLNLADLIGLTEEELLDDMSDCERRNRFRGRYEV